MATAKRTTYKRKTTKKAAAPKKAATTKKKAAPKKAPAKAAVATPAPRKPQGGSLYLHTEGGEVTLTFNSDEAFKAAVAQAESAPRDGGGSRTPPAVKHVEGAHRAWTFRMVHSFKATPAS
jgi:hypothetical protein